MPSHTELEPVTALCEGNTVIRLFTNHRGEVQLEVDEDRAVTMTPEHARWTAAALEVAAQAAEMKG